jgi:hypothetical protein
MFAPYDLISLPTAQAEMDLPQLRCGEEAEDDGSSIVKDVQKPYLKNPSGSFFI